MADPDPLLPPHPVGVADEIRAEMVRVWTEEQGWVDVPASALPHPDLVDAYRGEQRGFEDRMMAIADELHADEKVVPAWFNPGAPETHKVRPHQRTLSMAPARWAAPADGPLNLAAGQLQPIWPAMPGLDTVIVANVGANPIKVAPDREILGKGGGFTVAAGAQFTVRTRASGYAISPLGSSIEVTYTFTPDDQVVDTDDGHHQKGQR